MFTTRSLTRLAFVASLTAMAAPAFADSPFTGKTGALTFDIDSGKSQIKFDASGPAEVVKGIADGVSGTIKVGDAANPETTSGTLIVPVAKMRTGNEQRDSHLKDPVWLNAGANPNVTFTIQRVEHMAAGKGVAVGNFTLNGVTKPLTAPVEVKYAADRNALKITTSFKISLKDFNVKGKSGLVGSKVGETIAIEALVYATGK